MTLISRVQENIFTYLFWHMLVVIIHQNPRDWSSLLMLFSGIRLRWGTTEHLECLHGIMNLFLLCLGVVSLLSTKQRSMVSTGSTYSSRLQFTCWQSTFKSMFAVRHFFCVLHHLFSFVSVVLLFVEPHHNWISEVACLCHWRKVAYTL